MYLGRHASRWVNRRRDRCGAARCEAEEDALRLQYTGAPLRVYLHQRRGEQRSAASAVFPHVLVARKANTELVRQSPPEKVEQLLCFSLFKPARGTYSQEPHRSYGAKPRRAILRPKTRGSGGGRQVVGRTHAAYFGLLTSERRTCEA